MKKSQKVKTNASQCFAHLVRGQLIVKSERMLTLFARYYNKMCIEYTLHIITPRVIMFTVIPHYVFVICSLRQRRAVLSKSSVQVSCPRARVFVVYILLRLRLEWFRMASLTIEPFFINHQGSRLTQQLLCSFVHFFSYLFQCTDIFISRQQKKLVKLL